MNLLLDTRIFLWAVTDDRRLLPRHRELFLDRGNNLYLSLASAWEIAIKTSLGKLTAPTPAAEWVDAQQTKNRITRLGIHTKHLVELQALPHFHRDPFDRILAAQARVEGMAVLTVDPAVAKYGVEVL
jgi:PIN domain nuclease of toxin-antitoxin system